LDASRTIPDRTKVEQAVPHVVHDYLILQWCRWAVDQDENVFKSIVRSHLAFSYFLPYRAFADFFSNKRWQPDDLNTGDVDVHAVDFSEHSGYETTQWDNWLPHMNTHLFHINYFRTRSTRQFDASPVINAIHTEFESNWKGFIDGLRGDFPKLFKTEMDRRNQGPHFKMLSLYP